MSSLSEKMKMSGTTFPSNPCYFPIFEYPREGGLEKYNETWLNFVRAGPEKSILVKYREARKRIKEFNGTIINDVVVFETEQDKVWFILKWS
jgi:hypothetical protein